MPHALAVLTERVELLVQRARETVLVRADTARECVTTSVRPEDDHEVRSLVTLARVVQPCFETRIFTLEIRPCVYDELETLSMRLGCPRTFPELPGRACPAYEVRAAFSKAEAVDDGDLVRCTLLEFRCQRR